MQIDTSKFKNKVLLYFVRIYMDVFSRNQKPNNSCDLWRQAAIGALIAIIAFPVVIYIVISSLLIMIPVGIIVLIAARILPEKVIGKIDTGIEFVLFNLLKNTRQLLIGFDVVFVLMGSISLLAGNASFAFLCLLPSMAVTTVIVFLYVIHGLRWLLARIGELTYNFKLRQALRSGKSHVCHPVTYLDQ